MIIQVKALDLRVGMEVSTDGMQITQLVDYRGLLGKIYVGGVCHGAWKEKMLNPEEELPIYFKTRFEGRVNK